MFRDEQRQIHQEIYELFAVSAAARGCQPGLNLDRLEETIAPSATLRALMG